MRWMRGRRWERRGGAILVCDFGRGEKGEWEERRGGSRGVMKDWRRRMRRFQQVVS